MATMSEPSRVFSLEQNDTGNNIPEKNHVEPKEPHPRNPDGFNIPTNASPRESSSEGHTTILFSSSPSSTGRPVDDPQNPNVRDNWVGSDGGHKDPSWRESSGAISPNASATGFNPYLGPRKYFHSRRIQKGSIERPWAQDKEPREKWFNTIPIIGLFIGVAVSGILIWTGLRTVQNHDYCEVLNENFTHWNGSLWTKEVEVGGYGNGQFEMTTTTEENVFLRDGMLWIKPTLQNKSLVEQNTVLDFRGNGCTGNTWESCVTATNTTNGTIVNPVKSGRIHTKFGASIKFGRVEVTAQLPAGDWLWPAIWMLPVDNRYGEWPRSGEIDIIESRGNNYTYKYGGNNIVSSTLHFGPNSAHDGWWLNLVKRKALHTTFAEKFHTFGVEWSEKYIFTYIDSRLRKIMYTPFREHFWKYGRFPLTDSNGTRLIDPWGHTGNPATPFDQDFYLILNVAVGGTNNWFADGHAGKPWIDGSPTARKDFWEARDQWYPTWQEKGQMKVKSIKMLQQKGHRGC